MTKMLRFWQALEQVPGLAAVTAEWESLLGPEYEAVKGFFRPSDKPAQSYPCPLPRGCGCAHAVVQHGPDDIVAVCTCIPRRCEPTKLTKTDIIIYTLDRRALGLAVAGALHFDHKEEAVGGLPMTRRLGSYRPCAGTAFPVYLTIQIESEDFERVVEGLAARSGAPFILLAPTGGLCTQPCEELLRTRKACFLPLAEILVWEDGNVLTAVRAVEDTLGEFVAGAVLDKGMSSSAELLPTAEQALQPTFRREGKKWTVAFDGKTVYLNDQIGMHYISRLLSSPDRPSHAVLMRAEVAGNMRARAAGSAGIVLDQKALEDYRRRILDLREDLAIADARNDLATQDSAQRELEMVTAEVLQATGLGGKKRKASDDTERARKSVSNAIDRSIKQIKDEHPKLWRHLRKSIQLGQFPSYSPAEPVTWLT